MASLYRVPSLKMLPTSTPRTDRIGAPQTWTVTSGKTLSVNNDVHTVVSNLTIGGDGDTSISGTIDGGGILNVYGGAAPGNLTKTGTGTLTLSGASNYSGDITVSSGTIDFAPGSGVSATYSGEITGSGEVVKSGSGRAKLSNSDNAYTGDTTITGGALQVGE